MNASTSTTPPDTPRQQTGPPKFVLHDLFDFVVVPDSLLAVRRPVALHCLLVAILGVASELLDPAQQLDLALVETLCDPAEQAWWRLGCLACTARHCCPADRATVLEVEVEFTGDSGEHVLGRHPAVVLDVAHVRRRDFERHASSRSFMSLAVRPSRRTVAERGVVSAVERTETLAVGLEPQLRRGGEPEVAARVVRMSRRHGQRARSRSVASITSWRWSPW